MAITDSENKTALLFVPLKLTSQKDIVRSIHINKSNGLTRYDITTLDENEIRKQYSHQPKAVKDALAAVTEQSLIKIEEDIIKKYKLQKSGVPLRQFLIPAYTRRLVQQLEILKPFLPC